MRDLFRRCLINEPRNRVRDIGDARIAIGEVKTGTEAAEVSQTFLRRRSNMVNTPSTGDPLSFAISPDGRRLVFSASNEGKSQLWVRALDSLAAKPLADGATSPFWSPDSASVGFFADGKLKRIAIVGGAPQILANAAAGRGGAWNREGTIVFAIKVLPAHFSDNAEMKARFEREAQTIAGLNHPHICVLYDVWNGFVSSSNDRRKKTDSLRADVYVRKATSWLST